ncbi:citrate lyase ligase [Fervidicella metallireducens AeB]|uniref:[Citrate [pro-3S]-lyase] ligase n=1 Tax=Fervidicella metallireducens AeB TaxID=1403537 RepID=A0A017RWM5_9CLOT|nr:[citrate (pro-3S)-lyase] ligase [Fervidicella metallireducens]EYE88986.1 citrate lyase ligase [Fervidicella metallireducens AeB]
MNNLLIERINLNSPQKKEVEEFLFKFDLLLDKDVENTIVARNNNRIVGTCSSSGSILKCFAVDSEIQGEGISSKLITEISNILFDRGIYETFIYTKPKNKRIFEGLGYKSVHETSEVLLLEGGMANVKSYVNNMFVKSGLDNRKKSGIVMNCNPFTEGHRYLIERAASESEQVVVFIVEENRSLFPFKTRLELVEKGVADLKNVCVIPGGKYIISSATFPSYFLRQEDERLMAYTKLDAGIFGKYIAPAFNIEKRYVGTEPYCRVTGQYNSALMEVLPQYGVEVKLIERFQREGRAISASEVRNIIRNGTLEELKDLVPETTYDFLISKEAEEIIEKIKRSDTPH